MKLKKIKVSGFKSFVDPTTLSMSEQIIGVVGPNGCGKSNVIDAIRWVMGESSAKMLRGDNMADVIFNGSTRRKPVGKASVELVFANTEGKVPEPYNQFRELSIQRVLSRDGKSEYFINGARCRRKDIIDIFLGTGLGPRSYSVIEQGMVSRIVEAKPDDLRVFVEEAAGVSRYRERRRETENRIRHTRDNLERLEQRLDELNKSINRLQRQARDAKRFSELRDDQRSMQMKVDTIRWCHEKDRLEKFDLELNQIGVDMESKVATLRDIEKNIEVARTEQNATQEHFNNCQRIFYETANLVSTLEERIRVSEEGVKRLDRDLEDAHTRFKEVADELELLESDLAESRAQLTNVEPQIAEMEALIDKREQEREAVVTARQQWQQQWESHQQHRNDADRQLQIQQTKQQNIERQKQLLLERRGRFEKELEELTAEVPQQVDDNLLDEVEGLNASVVESKTRLAEKEAQHAKTDEAYSTSREQLAKLREERSALMARRDSVSVMLEKQSAQGNEVLDRVIRENGIDVIGHVVDHINVREGYEKQTDALLHSVLNAPIISAKEGNISRLAAVSELSGEWIVLESDNSETPFFSAQLFDGAALLGEIHACASLEEGLERRNELNNNAFFVSPEGHRIGRGYLKLAGTSAAGGVFASQAELEEYEKDIARHNEQINSQEEHIASLVHQREASDADIKTLRTAIVKAQDRLTHHQQQSLLNEERWQQVVKRKNQLHHELEDIQQNLARLDEEFEQSEHVRKESLSQLDGLTERDAHLQQERDQHAARVDVVEKELREKRAIVEQQRLQRERLLSVIANNEQQIQRLNTTREELTLRIETWTKERVDLSQTDPQAESKLTVALAERREHEELVSAARTQLEKSQQAIEALERERYKQEQTASVAREAVESGRVNRQEYVVRLDQFRAVVEEYRDEGISLEEWATQIRASVTDEDGLLEDLEGLNKRIERIGNVNLLAIEEFEQEQERQTHLQAQFADLTEALAMLEGVIKKIDADTRRLFNETFRCLNEGFGEFFPRLFGGGSATLALTEDDELTAGVTLMARPPGKRNSTIHLLSGGEKALTAVALMFALFELNPAPFCLLDEVDAPLDDANVRRYCDTLQTIAEKTQLIFITHNKITMSIANTLMGVTMSEPGVSRIVTVSMDEAVRMAE